MLWTRTVCVIESRQLGAKVAYDDRLIRVATRRRRIRLARGFGAVTLGIAAATEFLVGIGPTLLALLGGLGLILLPSLALAGTIWLPKWSGAFGWTAAGLSSGLAVIVASSCPPISHVDGAQAVGLAVVAIGMFAVSVLRGGFATAMLKETKTLGPLGIRVAPKHVVEAHNDCD